MSIFKNLQNAFHDFINSTKHFFFDFASPLIDSIEHNGGKVLTDAAMAAVSAAENTPGGGAERFAAAFASVVATLTAEGIPVVKNAVNGAIEAAVAAHKAAAPAEAPAA